MKQHVLRERSADHIEAVTQSADPPAIAASAELAGAVFGMMAFFVDLSMLTLQRMRETVNVRKRCNESILIDFREDIMDIRRVVSHLMLMALALCLGSPAEPRMSGISDETGQGDRPGRDPAQASTPPRGSRRKRGEASRAAPHHREQARRRAADWDRSGGEIDAGRLHAAVHQPVADRGVEHFYAESRL